MYYIFNNKGKKEIAYVTTYMNSKKINLWRGHSPCYRFINEDLGSTDNFLPLFMFSLLSASISSN